MAVVSVQGITNAGGLVRYLFHGRGQEDTSRAAAFALSMPGEDEPSVAAFVAKARRLALLNGRKNQMYSYVQSFSKDEFSVASLRDLETVRDIACLLAESMHNADYMVVVHDDAAGGNAHAHIAVINSDNETGKALDRYTSWAHGLHQLNDEVVADCGLMPLPDPSRKLGAWVERRKDFAKDGVERALGDAVDAVLHDPACRDMDTYKTLLAERGVTVAETARDGLTYKMREASTGKLRRRRATRLSPDFVKDNVLRQLEANKLLAPTKLEPEVREPLPEPVKHKPEPDRVQAKPEQTRVQTKSKPEPELLPKRHKPRVVPKPKVPSKHRSEPIDLSRKPVAPPVQAQPQQRSVTHVSAQQRLLVQNYSVEQLEAVLLKKRRIQKIVQNYSIEQIEAQLLKARRLQQELARNREVAQEQSVEDDYEFDL